MFGFLAMLFSAVVLFTPAESVVATTVLGQIDNYVQIESVEDSNLTQFTVANKSFKLDIQPVDYSKMND